MTQIAPNLKGIALMTLAMAFLAAGDAMIKVMSDDFAQPVFMVVSGAGLVACYFVISIFTGDQILSSTAEFSTSNNNS